MTNQEEIKDKFFENLENAIEVVPKEDKLILFGDFNTRVGTDHQTWEGITGRNGVGKCNSNGLLLLKTCASHDLLITNTACKTASTWHLVDYIIVRRRDRRDVRVTKAMCSADCWTDRRLILSKLNLQVQPKRRSQGQTVNKRLNVSKIDRRTRRQNLVQHPDTKASLI